MKTNDFSEKILNESRIVQLSSSSITGWGYRREQPDVYHVASLEITVKNERESLHSTKFARFRFVDKTR